MMDPYLWQVPLLIVVGSIAGFLVSTFAITFFGEIMPQAYFSRNAIRVGSKLAPIIRRIYDQMPQPKWVISMGACASTGGIFDTYTMAQGIDTIVPVDIYVPGCPPRPEGLLYGILMLHKKIRGETFTDPTLREEQLIEPGGMRLPPDVVDEVSEPFGNSVHQTRSA